MERICAMIPLARAAAFFAAVLCLASLSMRLGPKGRSDGLRPGLANLFFAAVKIVSRESRARFLSFGPLSAAAPLALASAFMISAAVPLLSGLEGEGALPSVALYRQGSGLIFSLAMVSLWALFLFLSRCDISRTGACRAAQGVASTHLSCFLAMCLAAASILLLTSTADISRIVEGQSASPLGWNALRQPAAFLIFFAAMCASVEAPAMVGFDFAATGAEELPASYQAGSKAALATLSGHVALASMALVAASVFLGGWRVPFAAAIEGAARGAFSDYAVQAILAALGVAVAALKASAMIWCACWLRSNMGRLRSDRFFSLGWRFMLPLALANLAATALLALR